MALFFPFDVDSISSSILNILLFDFSSNSITKKRERDSPATHASSRFHSFRQQPIIRAPFREFLSFFRLHTPHPKRIVFWTTCFPPRKRFECRSLAAQIDRLFFSNRPRVCFDTGDEEKKKLTFSIVCLCPVKRRHLVRARRPLYKGKERR